MNEWEEQQLARRLGIPVARVQAERRRVAADLEALLIAEGNEEARHRFRQTATAAMMRQLLARGGQRKKARPKRPGRTQD